MSPPGSGFTKSAWILTFYAFKGGTGRTLALSNVARYLAEARGYRIGVVDLDLESPGLPHQPLSAEWEEPNASHEGGIRSRIDRSQGFVELFLSLTGPRELGAGPGLTPAQIAASVVPLGSSTGNGSLFLIPAATQSGSRSLKFQETLRSFDTRLAELQAGRTAEEFQGYCADRLHELLQGFVEQYSLDYVFIDGRTGVGSFHTVYASHIPHALVLFCSLNEQNIEGSLGILEYTVPHQDLADAPIFLVVSPTPTVGPEFLEQRLGSISQKLADLQDRREDLGFYAYQLPREAEFLLPYTDLAAYRETYFIRDFPHSGLTREYVRLAAGIESLVVDPARQLPGASDDEFLAGLEGLCGRPLRIVAENIALEPLREFIEDLLGGKLEVMEAGGGKPSNRTRLLFRFASPPGAAVEVELWPATDPEAPWERLARGADHVQGGAPLPDILMVPQSALADVCANLEGVLELDTAGEGGDEIIDYGFLDAWYPGWRRWCTDQSAVRALPFSMNTTILCANDRHLEKLCGVYWRARGHPERDGEGAAFFPSNWHLLLEMVRETVGTTMDFVPTTVARHGRGLYYEWLNVVLSFGGADSETGDGNVALNRWSPALKRDGTMEGTKFFLDLVRETTRAAAEARRDGRPALRMDELVVSFWEQDLSFFTGWTDSFRFVEDVTRPARIDMREECPGQVPVRLGRVPRDIRHRRRPLVANWVAVITRSPAATAGLAFMRHFLDPATQIQLLWNGFPCPSRPVVERALQDYSSVAAGAGRTLTDQNRAVFLAALLDALEDGYLVPSFRHSTEWIECATDHIGALVHRVEAGEEAGEDDIREVLAEMSESLHRLHAGAAPLAGATT